LFSKGIELDPNHHVLWSNRSAAKAGKKDWEGALADADQVRFCVVFTQHVTYCGSQCIKVNASWAKGYARKGAALHGAKRYDEAIAAYDAGIKLEDSPALRKGLQEVKDAKGIFIYSTSCVLSDLTFLIAHSNSDESFGLGKLFSDPNIMAKLAGNPRTAKHLADPSFVQTVGVPPPL